MKELELSSSENLQYFSDHFKRPEFRTSGEKDMGVFLETFTDGFEQHMHRQTGVLFIEGLPSSGKTFLTDKTIDYLNIRFNSNVHIIHLHWDKLEANLRHNTYRDYIVQLQSQMGDFFNPHLFEDVIQRITKYHLSGHAPPEGEPDTPEFLGITNSLLKAILAEEIHTTKITANDPPCLIVVEKPNGAALKKAGGWNIDKEYGPKDMEQLLTGRDALRG